MKCPQCGFENEEGSNFCKYCGVPLSKQDYSEDNPYVKRRRVEDQLNNKANEEDEMKEKIEKEERIRAEARAKAEKEVKDKEQKEKKKKGGFFSTVWKMFETALITAWILRFLGIIDF